jgi:hypothetical protein
MTHPSLRRGVDLLVALLAPERPLPSQHHLASEVCLVAHLGELTEELAERTRQLEECQQSNSALVERIAELEAMLVAPVAAGGDQ